MFEKIRRRKKKHAKLTRIKRIEVRHFDSNRNFFNQRDLELVSEKGLDPSQMAHSSKPSLLDLHC